MIEIDLTDGNLAVITPVGALSAQDFAKLTETINDYINREDKVPNLVIRAAHLPHWDSFEALTRHIAFVRDHHRLVAKIAVVGDHPALTVLPVLADHFVKAKIRRFAEARLSEAMEWAAAEGDHPGRFEPIDGLPDDVLALEAKGIITARDYRDTLVPMMQEKLAKRDKVKFLIVMGEAFESYSDDAAWEDFRFGVSHWSNFARIALVSDISWLRTTTQLFSPLIRSEVKVFHLAELDKAKAWIKT